MGGQVFWRGLTCMILLMSTGLSGGSPDQKGDQRLVVQDGPELARGLRAELCDKPQVTPL